MFKRNRDVLVDVTNYSHKNFTELAGNAFNGYAFLAFVIAAFTTVPLSELAASRKFKRADESEVDGSEEIGDDVEEKEEEDMNDDSVHEIGDDSLDGLPDEPELL